MKTIFKLLLVLSLTQIVGCGNKAVSTISSQSQLFQDPALKADWETATAAMKTNGYVAAQMSLRDILKHPVTDAQLNAVNDATKAINTQMYAAADRGNLQASNAVVQLMNTPR